MLSIDASVAVHAVGAVGVMNWGHLSCREFWNVSLPFYCNWQSRTVKVTEQLVITLLEAPPIIRFGEVGIGKVGFGEVGIGKVGFGKVGFDKMGFGEVGFGKVGFGKMGFGEMDSAKWDLAKWDSVEVGFGEVGENRFSVLFGPFSVLFGVYTYPILYLACSVIRNLMEIRK